MPLVNFWKKIRFFSFDFYQNFEVWTFSRWLSIRRTKLFWRDIQNFFSFKMFTWVVLDGFLNGFSKIRFFIVEICILIRDFGVIFENYSMHMLSIRGNDFIAHWVSEETISSHTEHTPNEFSHMVSQRKNMNSFTYTDMLSIRGNDFIAPWAYVEMFKSRISRRNRIWFSKISCYRPLGP